jgi:hypothetical protein
MGLASGDQWIIVLTIVCNKGVAGSCCHCCFIFDKKYERIMSGNS